MKRPDRIIRRTSLTQGARILGALALLAVGIEHIQQYYAASYSVLPTIGTLFVLNFAGAVVVTAGLLAPLRRMHAVLALAGIAIAAGSLVALFISESSGLFGFRELGYRPVIVLSIVLEATTVVALGTFLVLSGVARRPAPPTPLTRHAS